MYRKVIHDLPPRPPSGAGGRLIIVFEKPDGTRYAWEREIPAMWIVQVERFYRWLERQEVRDLIGFFNTLKSIGLI